MFKNNKGVTLTMLLVTVVIMFVIVSATITTGYSLLRNTQKNRLKANLYLVKSKAEALLEDYLFDGTNNLGENVTTEEDWRIVTASGWKSGDRDTYGIIYSKWKLDFVKKQGISTDNMTSNESFIIRYDPINNEVDVASTRGFKDKNKRYYSLTQLLQ